MNFSITILFAFFILCFLNRKKEFEDALLMDSSENLLFEQFVYLYLSVYLLIPNKLISYLQKMANVIYQVIRKNDFTTFQKMDTIIPYIIVFAAPLSMKVKPCCSQAWYKKWLSFLNISVATFEQNATLETNIFPVLKFRYLKPASIMSSRIETKVLSFLSNLSKSFMPTCRIAASYSYSLRISILWRLNCFAFNPVKDLRVIYPTI